MIETQRKRTRMMAVAVLAFALATTWASNAHAWTWIGGWRQVSCQSAGIYGAYSGGRHYNLIRYAYRGQWVYVYQTDGYSAQVYHNPTGQPNQGVNGFMLRSCIYL